MTDIIELLSISDERLARAQKEFDVARARLATARTYGKPEHVAVEATSLQERCEALENALRRHANLIKDFALLHRLPVATSPEPESCIGCEMRHPSDASTHTKACRS
jgi:hypothetical protein